MGATTDTAGFLRGEVEAFIVDQSILLYAAGAGDKGQGQRAHFAIHCAIPFEVYPRLAVDLLLLQQVATRYAAHTGPVPCLACDQDPSPTGTGSPAHPVHPDIVMMEPLLC